jgi:hypothetical protein
MTHEEAKSVDNHFHRSIVYMKCVPRHNLERIYKHIDLFDQVSHICSSLCKCNMNSMSKIEYALCTFNIRTRWRRTQRKRKKCLHLSIDVYMLSDKFKTLNNPIEWKTSLTICCYCRWRCCIVIHFMVLVRMNSWWNHQLRWHSLKIDTVPCWSRCYTCMYVDQDHSWAFTAFIEEQ